MSKKETPEEKKAREMVEEIACNISKLSRQVSTLLDGRIKKNTFVILLAHSTRLPQVTIENVLDAITNLEEKYLK